MLGAKYKQRISQMQAELVQLLAAEFMPFASENVSAIPEAPGIYLIRENETIVYCGSAQNLRLRLWKEHYLGEQVRMGGSQFRGILNRVHPELKDNEALTQHIGKHCSFAFLEKEPVEKRELKFFEKFCNSVLKPDFIEYGASGKVWAASQRQAYPIMYNCEDCGREFASGRRRSGPKLCKDCIEKRRREGRGPRQRPA